MPPIVGFAWQVWRFADEVRVLVGDASDAHVSFIVFLNDGLRKREMVRCLDISFEALIANYVATNAWRRIA